VNVGYDVFRIQTRISERGEEVESGHIVDERDKRTRDRQWKELDDDLQYDSSDLDKDIVAEDQIRTIIRTYRYNLDTLFPGRDHVPKTLIFAKDDSHAEDITRIVREVFGKGSDFCKKITYKTTSKDPDDLISEFRNSYNPRIAVSVDMVSTGVDIKPLEVLMFMRNVNSRTYFEQMKGRGTRTISKDDIQSVTPDADGKDHFLIVDAVGVCQSDKTDSHSMNRSRSTPFDSLVENVAEGERDDDTLETLASRLARRQNRWTPSQIEEVEEAADKEFRGLINDLLDATDPDEQEARAKEKFDTEDPTDDQIQAAKDELVQKGCKIYEDEEFRETLLIVDEQQKQIIDTVSQDEVISAELDEQAKEQAEAVVDTFEEFIEENKNEITALQLMYGQPYGEGLSYDEVKELVEALEKPPYNLTPERIWSAYEQLDETAEEGSRSEVVLADVISLVRYELEQIDHLEPYSKTVDERFEEWLDEQGRENFTEEQLRWLRMIKDHIKSSVEVEVDDLESPPFNQHGGLYRAYELFGDDLDKTMDELNGVLV
jgi:type I restriction enzyme R subunit